MVIEEVDADDEAKNTVNDEQEEVKDQDQQKEDYEENLVYSPSKDAYVSIPKLDLDQLAMKKGNSHIKNQTSQFEVKLVESKLQ